MALPMNRRRPGFGVQVQVKVPRALKQMPTITAEIYERQLTLHLYAVARVMVAKMRSQLRPGHGYDTGKLYHSLTAKLVQMELNPGFDIIARDVHYWAYVEFGHMTVSGGWWEGYHYAENALKDHMKDLQDAADQAWTVAAKMIESSMRARGAFM